MSERFHSAVDRTPAGSRLVVVLTLFLAAIVWAILRGLNFYGLSPDHIGYDLDQPPLLLVFVAGWLLYRSRRK